MRWAWPIGRLFGIQFNIHYTFPLLLVYVGLSVYSIEHNWFDTIETMAFVLVVFLIVVLHELGHALAARQYGIPTRDITVTPIGGVARIERMPDTPLAEIVVALAGPAVNLALAGLLFGVWQALRLVVSHALPTDLHQWLTYLIWVNLALLAFNLLPAFPMDGGRVARALLAYPLGLAQATLVAVWIGRGLAVLMVLVALLSHNYGLALVAIFLWFGGAQELAMVQWRARVEATPVRLVMLERYQALLPDNTLGQAQDLLARFDQQQDFPVVSGGAVVGLLTRARLEAGLQHEGQATPVALAMSTLFPSADPDEPLGAVLARLHDRQFLTLPVIFQNQLCGVLALERVPDRLRAATSAG